MAWCNSEKILMRHSPLIQTPAFAGVFYIFWTRGNIDNNVETCYALFSKINN